MNILRGIFRVLVLLGAGYAQSFSQGERTGFPSATAVGSMNTNYYFARPSELTITVDVIGFVQRPGRYEISSSISLVNLLSLAGGATIDGSLSDVKVTRVTESEGILSVRELRVNLNNIAAIPPSELILSPGDVIQVERTTWSGFKDAFGIVVSLATVTIAVAQVMIATK